MRVWLCEKPDQAKALAPVLGGAKQGSGFIDTHDGRITWCIGHLLQQAPPEVYRAEWARWSLDALPMVPRQWKAIPDPDKSRQLAVVVEQLKAASEVVIATDYGAEGEAIAREVIEYARCTARIRRLKYSALDETSLKRALASLLDGKVSEPLYWGSQARSRADWLVGMNLSRAFTLRHRAATGEKVVLSVGRVQSPTLALVVRRDREIEGFVSRSFYDLEAVATTLPGESVTLRYSPAEADRLYDRPAAELLVRQMSGFEGPIRVEKKECAKAHPKLLDLTGFTKATSKKYGWKADYALAVAQALYDKKLTTYPRTDCVCIPNEQEGDIPHVVAAISKVPALSRAAGALTVGTPVVRNSVFNTAKVNASEHHAIIPTTSDPSAVEMTADEKHG